jgi:hypothetical protein
LNKKRALYIKEIPQSRKLKKEMKKKERKRGKRHVKSK